MQIGMLLALSLLTTMSRAQNSNQIEAIIAASWAPHVVTCVWESAFGDASVLDSWEEVTVINGLEECAHDQLTLTLSGVDSNGVVKRLTVKGRARIFGQAFGVSERLKIGDEIKLSSLVPLECEWSNLRAIALLDVNAIAGKFAVRPLIPGRAILAGDVRPRAIVKSGDSVTVFYEQGGVCVKVEGIAMKDGGVGETIPVRVPEVDKNRLEGVIQDDATLRWNP